MSDIWSLLEVVLHVTKCAFLLHGQFDCQVEGLSWDVARATDCWSPHDSFWPQMCLALLLSSYKAIDYMTWISSRKWQEESWSTGFHTLWVFLRPCRITRLIYVGLVIPGLTFELLDTQPCLDHLNTSASKALWRLDLKTQVSQMSVPQLISLTGKQIQKKKFIALQHSGKALRIVTLHSQVGGLVFMGNSQVFANCSKSDRGCLSNDIRHTVESRGKFVIKSEGGRLGKLHHAHASLCQGTRWGFGLVLDNVMDRDRANERGGEKMT